MHVRTIMIRTLKLKMMVVTERKIKTSTFVLLIVLLFLFLMLCNLLMIAKRGLDVQITGNPVVMSYTL